MPPFPAMTRLVVETTRASCVENRHEIIGLALDGDRPVRSHGPVDRRIPVRSTVKPVQALALLGLAGTDLAAQRVALACASHSGEDVHVEGVLGWLHDLGLTEDDLRCAARPPHPEAPAAPPRRARHNCSGKHTGFLDLALRLDTDPATYLEPSGPVQQTVLAAVSEACATPLGDADVGRDGCGAPAPFLPLAALARGFRTALTGDERGTRIVGAVRTDPRLLAGTDRFDTRLIERTEGRVVAKVGADGVHVATTPDDGATVAVKAVDGDRRAAQFGLVHLLEALGVLDPDEAADLGDPVIHDDEGNPVGSIRSRVEPD